MYLCCGVDGRGVGCKCENYIGVDMTGHSDLVSCSLVGQICEMPGNDQCPPVIYGSGRQGKGKVINMVVQCTWAVNYLSGSELFIGRLRVLLRSS